MVQKVLLSILVSFFFCCVISAQAQVAAPQSLSSIKVDELSDAQIRQLLAQMQASGVDDAQLEQIAAAKGMSSEEVGKLRTRVDIIKRQQTATPATRKKTQSRKVVTEEGALTDETAATEEEKAFDVPVTIPSRVFGSELFSKTNLTFEPNLRIATPVDYLIGPDDQILLDIYGFSEANYSLTVSPEGSINIPMAGVVQVAGATIEQASSRIRAKLTTLYPGIKTGNTKVGISLGNIRSIKVVLTGEIVKPGTYTLPSVANVFNALYASGGPNENGSFRQVQIIRGAEIIAILDIYDFLLYGTLKNNIRLQDQDVIRIPPYKTRVEINGKVKRPAIYEMKFNETLGDLIRFAGGYDDNAYKARIKNIRNTETERSMHDVTSDEVESYVPVSGDKFFVDELLNRFTNRVTINGAVFRPGQFELSSGLSLKQLIARADGLKEDAFPNRGYITRLKDDLTREVISFNTADIVSGNVEDIVLKREDIISIPSSFDLKEEYNIHVTGEVRNPGVLPYSENLSLEDVIIQSGGLKEGATAKRIEIARRVRISNLTSDTSTIAQIFTVSTDRNLKDASNFILKPFDIISVFPAPGYQVQKTIRIEGEVLFPGTYILSSKNDRISDIIKRAGGLTASAYKDGASLKRERRNKTQLELEQEELKAKKFKTIQKKATDSTRVEDEINTLIVSNKFVGIDLNRILKKPHQRNDLLLEDGDVISIPKQLQTVRVSGEVLSSSAVVYYPGNSLKNYILKAGGFTSNAHKKRTYITYANGSVQGTKNFLFFRTYPKVKPGSEIFVPLKPENKNRLSTTEVVAITTALTTVATLVYTIFKK